MDVRALEAKSAEVRLRIVETVAAAEKGHIGGALSCADILVALYYGRILKVDPGAPQWPDRDRFILSKGHVGAALYVVLADLGFFDPTELERLNRGGMLGEHPDRGIPGVEIDSGSLGHGLGIGAGMALAAKLDGKEYRTFVLLGDGECYEGSVWEASMFASHHRLHNLIAIVDRNEQIVNDFTESINRLNPLASKWDAFGWRAIEVDGHSLPGLVMALDDARNAQVDKPTVIIANTIKGKGVSFMEGQLAWHHGSISGARFDSARSELTDSLRRFEFSGVK